ncbi:MAG: IclR family transcriptional regulator [Spirochaetia bacterium]|jgi:IclR family KDG regulon transcriptional repressor|nr:IclR family transcriptional regulator [Spirochaetia bacterium]
MVQNTNACSNNDTNPYVLSTTVVKAFDILEYIASNQPVSPSDITRNLKLTRSNVHRLLATFVSMGYISKNDNAYFLSFKLFQLGNSIPFFRDLKTIAKPFMSRLMEKVNENIYLNVLSGDMIIAIDMVKSNNHLTLNADKIYTYPLNTCASGKVFLSMLSNESVIETVNNLEMTGMTSSTIINRSILLDEIKAVKQKGYATEYQEFSEELNSVAAPVYDYMDQIVATISISGPANRLNPDKINKYLNELIDTASEVTKQSGN